MPNNYGDVALNLGPDWDRNRFPDKGLISQTVGHKAGISDLHKKADPEARHQFAWVDPRYHDEIAAHRANGFKVIVEDEWVKAEDLWDWNAEHHVVWMGQIGYARPAALYFEADAKKQKEINRRLQKDEEEMAEAKDRLEASIRRQARR